MARPRKNPAEAIGSTKTSGFFDESEEAVETSPEYQEEVHAEELTYGVESPEGESAPEDKADPVEGADANWRLLDPEALIGDLPPRNGMPVRLSFTPNGEGILGFWKRTRAFSNPTKKWVDHGKWCDFLTGYDMAFTPRYWRERY